MYRARSFLSTARSSSSASAVANRYVEGALAQVAALRLRDVRWVLALVTNIEDPRLSRRTRVELVKRIESLGVNMVPTAYGRGQRHLCLLAISARRHHGNHRESAPRATPVADWPRLRVARRRAPVRRRAAGQSDRLHQRRVWTRLGWLAASSSAGLRRRCIRS
jgi:hypothetical protein